MIPEDTYSYADSDNPKKGWIRKVLMPHTALEDLKKDEGLSATEMLKDDAGVVSDKKKLNKVVYISVGAIVLVGLGVGLYFAFRKNKK